ncbi:MAG TPA: TonB-dependent receptor [Bryobacteraceae bacterium]|nr:TonB-dependent receptor [Bryobacteraceae bacterium]
MLQQKRLFLLGLLVCASAFAQVDRATLTGTVTDGSGAAIEGAIVAAESANTGFRREAATSNLGVYQLPGLAVGTYRVSISKVGFGSVKYDEVVLTVGHTRTLDVQLQVGAVASAVDVVATATPLEQTNAEIGTVISEQQIRNIPLNGRHWASLMMLAPGAVNAGEGNQNSIRFFGRPRDDNNWTFDGVDATGIKDPRQEGNLRLVISTDSIAEFRVNSLPFTAESGIGGGAQINLVSRTGTNDFHGSMYEFLRNSALDARRPFDGANPPPFRLNQFGANLGGPIVKNRTFFFANYEGLLQRLSITRADGLVPSASFRREAPAALQGIINAYPVGTGPTTNPRVDSLVATTPERRNEHSGMARVDHRISDRHSLFFRFAMTDGLVSQIRNGLLETRDSYIRPTNAAAQWQQVWTSSLVNEVKLGFNRSALTRLDVGLIPEGVAIPSLTTTQPTTFIIEKPSAYSVLDNLSWIHGRHTVKAGGEIRRIHLNVGNGPATSVTFANIDAFLRNALDRTSVGSQLDTVGVRRTFHTFYVQDEIRLKSDLTINLGMRYEQYTVSKDVYGRGRVFDLVRCQGFCAPGTEWFFGDKNNIAPRISLAWAPEMLGKKTVIRAGYGRYFGPGQNDDVTAAIDSLPETFSLTAADAPGLSYPPTAFLGQLRSQGQTPRSVQRDRKEPESHQWTFSIQRELPSNMVAQVAYVGNVGRNQLTRSYVNTLDPVTRRRPLSTFGQIDEKRFDGNTSFNGLQSSLQRAFSKGLLFQAQYMWGNAISDNSGSGEGGQIQDVACRACDRGPADYDIRHTFTANSVYQLPFARASWFGGWDLSGLFTARTGRPFTVSVNRASAVVPSGQTQSQRANYIGGNPYAENPGPGMWLNPAAFGTPAAGTYGSSGRNGFRGPGLWQADLGVSKRFRITEAINVDFRTEAFNVFNRAQYGEPVSNLSTGTFGRILQTANDGATGTGTSRQLQFMLRLNF